MGDSGVGGKFVEKYYEKKGLSTEPLSLEKFSKGGT